MSRASQGDSLPRLPADHAELDLAVAGRSLRVSAGLKTARLSRYNDLGLHCFERFGFEVLVMTKRMPAVFFGHGNPMNALLRNSYTEHWTEIGTRLPRPKAILCLSAHWYIQDAAVTVSTDLPPGN